MIWKIVIAFPIFMHGLANLGGAVAPWTKSLAGFSNVPWLLSRDVTYQSRIGRIFSLFWLISTLKLWAAAAGIFLVQPWWTTLAIIGAAVSLVTILVWWKAVPPGARFGAVFDAVLLVALVSPLSEKISQLIQ